MNIGDSEPFGTFLGRKRRDASLTQGQLGDRALNKKKQEISIIERGDRVAHFYEVVRIHAAIREAGGPEIGSLGEWLVVWLRDLGRSQLLDNHRGSLEAALDAFDEAARYDEPLPEQPVSLTGFPDAFTGAWTVLCGDRRELPEESVHIGDLFAYSLAITDVSHLPLLRLKDGVPHVRSDKLVLLMSEADLERELGRSNLLVIGSPGVNWVARRVNRASLFRFDMSEWNDWDEAYRQENRLHDPEVFEAFKNILTAIDTSMSFGDVEERALREKFDIEANDVNFTAAASIARALLGRADGSLTTSHAIKEIFRRTPILDPVNLKILSYTRENMDLGLVSLASNPWDETGRHLAILVAGVHGLGTAQALKMLLQKSQQFVGRPYGGVIEVTTPVHEGWQNRFEHAHSKWVTKAYNGEALLQSLRMPINGRSLGETRRWLSLYGENERKAMADFVAVLLQRNGQ